MTIESLCGVQDRCGHCPVIKYRQGVIENSETRIAQSLEKGMRMLDKAKVAASDTERDTANATARYNAVEVATYEGSIPRIQDEIGELTANCDGPVKIRNVLTLGRTIYECDSRSGWRKEYRKIRFLQALYAEAKIVYQMRKVAKINK